MSDASPQQLLGHLLGALDEDEQDWLEWRLERDSGYRRQWAQWCRRMAPLEAFKPDFEPPPGLAERTCRFVAAHRSGSVSPPLPAIPSGDYLTGGHGVFGWSDVITLSILVVMAVAAIFPAIQDSRLQARVAACQDRLQKMGQGLSEYSMRRAIPVTHLAHHGRLTPTGAIVAQFLEGEMSADGRQVATDAWWAAQGLPGRAMANPIRSSSVFAAASPAAVSAESTLVPSTSEVAGDSTAGPRPTVHAVSAIRFDTPPSWPGTWRDGTAHGPSTPSPADMALLADAPSVDLPGQFTEYHGGRGRNLLFADGHIRVERARPPEVHGELIDLRSYGGQSPVPALPVTFVNY